MALTNEEKQELINAIKAESQSVDELPVVDSLDGVNSLPAIRGAEVVSAPITLLRKPAEDAAKVANNAATRAEQSAETAEGAAQTANSAAELAAAAANEASTAARETNAVKENAYKVVVSYEKTALAALKGATVRFDEYIPYKGEESRITILDGIPDTEEAIVYCEEFGRFVARGGNQYYSDWGNADSFNDGISIHKNKVYLCGEKMYVWSEDEATLVEASGSGSGSGFYNLTTEQPLQSGYYTLASAVESLSNADIDDDAKPGMIITFEESAGKWVDYRFCASSIENFLDVASWEEYGGGKIKEVSVNGQAVVPDADGKVDIVVERTEIDETLDANSTNPVQNSAITAKLNEIEANTVFGMSTEISDDESSVRLAITNKSGAEIASVDIPAGSGGGGGADASTTKIVLSASVDNSVIKYGGSSKLTYTYDHQYSSGDDKGVTTGQKANIEVTMKYGSSITYSNTIQDVGKGTYTLDLSKYLQIGTTDVYVRATTIDPGTGKTQTKQSYVSVKVVALSLTSSYNLANSIAGGGYGMYSTVNIPYAVSGSGTKVVSIYLDGAQYDAATVTRSGTTNGSFSIPVSVCFWAAILSRW